MSNTEYSLSNIVQAGNSYMSSGATCLLLPQLIQALLSSSDDKPLLSLSFNGTLTQPIETLLNVFKSNGGRLIINKSNFGDYAFLWKDKSYIIIDYTEKNKNISVSGLVLDPTLIELAATVEKDFVSKVKTNLIFTIVRNSYGLTISSMGDGSSPLIKENYLPQVIEDVDYVISSFSKNPPGGRIAILNGEPGTGKTFIIRSILTRMDCVFLIVPPNLIDSLDKPEFMPLLLSIKNDHNKPIVMIIEDGDACLVPRKNDNISTISSLLNLSDGIMGSIIDIKMIISTNADIKEMDQAIMRPGRLCRNICVGALPYEQANRVYARLLNKEDAALEYRKFYTLAEIYAKANNSDSTSTHNTQYTNKRTIGFAAPEKDLTINSLHSEMKIK